MTHRHVFFPDDAGPEAAAEWSCGCGHVALHLDGDLDGGLVVIAAAPPSEFAAVDAGATDALDEVVAPSREFGRRSA